MFPELNWEQLFRFVTAELEPEECLSPTRNMFFSLHSECSVWNVWTWEVLWDFRPWHSLLLSSDIRMGPFSQLANQCWHVIINWNLSWIQISLVFFLTSFVLQGRIQLTTLHSVFLAPYTLLVITSQTFLAFDDLDRGQSPVFWGISVRSLAARS